VFIGVRLRKAGETHAPPHKEYHRRECMDGQVLVRK
jgi:hypothetical protein